MIKLIFSDKEIRSLRFTILINLILAILSIAGLFLDSREIGGINPWIKPLKFQVSIILFVATVSWILRYLEPAVKRKIARQTAACMLIEIFIITLQALRGVRSHFNRAEDLDFILFLVMGLAIAYNTYLLGKLFYLFIRGQFSLPKVYLRGIQYSLASIILATIPAGMMIAQNSHTVGASDGGPGLPFLNWSLIHGDLRIAHFIGMHGFQIFIALGALLTFSSLKLKEKKGLIFLNTAFTFYLILTFGLFLQALSGNPLIASFSSH